MSHYSGNIDNFGMDSTSLAGPLEARLEAVQDAGFSQVMLSASDLVGHPGGLAAALAAVRTSGLRITGFQTLRDFEGLSGQLHDYKVDIAKSMLEMCSSLDCRLLLVQASTLRQASTDNRTLIRDLRKLAMLAIPMNIRIAYSPVASGHSATEFGQAWDRVFEADVPNLGLGLASDTVQLFAQGMPLDELDMLDPDKVFLVQLADFLWNDPADQAFRVFPGEGVHGQALAALVTRLHALGYRGDYSFEVGNSDYRQIPLSSVAQRARRAAVWLGEGVLQRSVPLPNHIRLKHAASR